MHAYFYFKENVGLRLRLCSLCFQVKPSQTTTPLLRSVACAILYLYTVLLNNFAKMLEVL